MAAATVLIAANIGTVIMCFTSHIQTLKDMLKFKVVQDSLLAIFIYPITKELGLEKYVIPLFIYLTGTASYELYWSIYVGTDYMPYLYDM